MPKARSVEFAYHIFKKLNVFESADLEHWYDYFGKHSTGSLMKFLRSTQGPMKEPSQNPVERVGRV